MQVALVDGSSSKFLRVVGEAGDDGEDRVLRLWRKPTPLSGYKNKPLPPSRERLGVYAVVDRCSGLTRSRYKAERGENALSAVEFILWALSDSGDPRQPMRGLPTELWSDQGPLVKSNAARDLLERLDVSTEWGEPYNKERMGQVERPWRTMWKRFEASLFLARRDEWLLSEVNSRLQEYEADENNRRPARRPRPNGGRWTRAQCWTALTNSRPADDRLRELPPNALETMASEARRKIDRNGIVRWGGVEYECEGWHDKWVLARRAVDGGGDLVLVDEETGERATATRWAPRPHGEIRGVPATPLERLLDAPPEFGGADVYAPKDARGNVVPIPPRTAPPAPIEDPLDADRLPDAATAMRLFSAICPGLSATALAMVRGEIERAGLSRAATEDLARELAAPQRRGSEA